MPNLIDLLDFRAKIEPASVAIQGKDQQLTFSQLLCLVKRIAKKLRNTGVKPGQTVVTSIGDKYLDWVITLALFHEATVSCSIQRYSPTTSSLVDYDWIITDRLVDCFLPEKTILADNDWLADLKNQKYNIMQIGYESKSINNRIVLTSGTTGRSKALAISSDIILQRAKNSIQYTCNYKNFISLFHISTGLGLNNAIISLINGSPFYCANTIEDAIDLIVEFSVEGIHGSVIQIGSLVQQALNANKNPVSVQIVIYAGSAASPSFLKGVTEHLSSNIYNDYGSTETAGICTFKPTPLSEPQICGYLYPDAEIQVVGESHTPLPLGEEGLLRARRPHMADGYYKNPQATAQSFRDGWFYPGDRGRLAADGLLILTGRDSEIINLGGAKINPETIDRFMADCPGVDDAAAFSFENHLGVQHICAAIVVADDFDLESLKGLILKKLPPLMRPARFVRVDRIPRNQAGKILRTRLRTELSEALST